jgi:hypothetical protein
LEPAYITTAEAARRARAAGFSRFSPLTIRRWAGRYSIGHRIGGRWVIDRAKLDALLRGEEEREATPSLLSAAGLER